MMVISSHFLLGVGPGGVRGGRGGHELGVAGCGGRLLLVALMMIGFFWFWNGVFHGAY